MSPEGERAAALLRALEQKTPEADEAYKALCVAHRLSGNLSNGEFHRVVNLVSRMRQFGGLWSTYPEIVKALANRHD